VVKTIGDEVMAIFPSAAPAGRAAVDIQLGIAGMAPVEKVAPGRAHRPALRPGGRARGRRLRGHGEPLGTVDRDGLAWPDHHVPGDGRGVRRAAAARLPPPLRDPGEGEGKDVWICEILWTDTDDATTLAAPRQRTEHKEGSLRVVYRGAR
jgi:class 3 adenylate cyclase